MRARPIRGIHKFVASQGLVVRAHAFSPLRMNAQALYMDRSAFGYTAVPYVVGGTGWVFTADWHLVLRLAVNCEYSLCSMTMRYCFYRGVVRLGLTKPVYTKA